jgi:hypothetical protein
MYLLVDSDIYLYNSLSTNCATHVYNNTENNRDNENTNFINSIKKKYLAIRDWDLKKIPKLSIGQFNDTGELIRKIKFVTHIVKQIPMPKIYSSNTSNIELIIKYVSENKCINLLNDLLLIQQI